MKIKTIWNERFGMLMASGSPGSALAYQLGSGAPEPYLMRRNMATMASPDPTPPPARAFEPTPVITLAAIERAQREAHRLRAQYMQEMFSAAAAWVWSLGHRLVSPRAKA